MKPLQFYSFWSINDELDVGKINCQMDELKQAGLSGVVFHPRYYPGKPEYLGQEYMHRVSDIILHAKEIGMNFWLYDENGWPSGTAGGEVLRRHPGLRCRWLELATADTRQPGQDREAAAAPEPECLLAFQGHGYGRAPESGGGQGEEYRLLLKTSQAVSSLDPTACAAFLELTHEGYKTGLNPEAFGYVTGFFSDEVAFLDGHSRAVECGGVPWDERLPLQYQEKYGEDLLPLLLPLFIGGEGAETVRARFWELMTDAINDGFYKPVKNWCEANGKLFTAHLKGEENPFFQVSYSGSCLEVLKNVTLPAIDALERTPGNNYFPRIAQSVSSQFYSGECLVEAMGGAGWGVTPEAFEHYMLWLAGHGIGHIVLHLNQLRLSTQAIHDWPPSTPCHMTWKEAFPEVLADINRKAAELPDPDQQPELLIVTPTRGVMAQFVPRQAMQINEHNGTNLPDTPAGRISEDFVAMVEECHQAGIRFELTEERAVEEYGKVAGGCLEIGQRKYDTMLIAAGCRWNEQGERMLESLREGGAGILKPETWRTHFEGLKQLNDARCLESSEVPELNTTIRNHDDTDDQQEELRSNSSISPLSFSSLALQAEPWIVDHPEENLLFIEWNKDTGDNSVGNEMQYYNLLVEDAEKLVGIELICMDEIVKASVNAGTLKGRFANDTHIFKIPAEYLQEGKNILQIRTMPGGEKNPVAFLKGRFAVRSLSGYKEKGDRQVATEGPFMLAPRSELASRHLVETGLPFCGASVTLHKKMHLEQCIGSCKIKLTEVAGDAARISIDGKDAGWCWGPDWTAVVPGGLSAGVHELSVSLIPSTFNVYGPHRHIDGDRHLTSPAQYEGTKNFADRPDVPTFTLCTEWSFVKLGIGEPVYLLQPQQQ